MCVPWSLSSSSSLVPCVSVVLPFIAMPYLGDDPKTLDAFMGLLAAVPSQAERLEVAASVMDDKSRVRS